MLLVIHTTVVLIGLSTAGGGGGQLATGDVYNYICNGHEFRAGDTASYICAKHLLQGLIERIPKSPDVGFGTLSNAVPCGGGGTVIRGWADAGGAPDARSCLEGAKSVLEDHCRNRVGARVWRHGDRDSCFLKYEKQ